MGPKSRHRQEISKYNQVGSQAVGGDRETDSAFRLPRRWLREVRSGSEAPVEPLASQQQVWERCHEQKLSSPASDSRALPTNDSGDIPGSTASKC